ncbi:MAG: hypothetical protein EKK57_11190 [Proteobacteria bacterium]|nr:MAG: hypothetical protein EKK57_11190 [Pseudomonadota bacterium]
MYWSNNKLATGRIVSPETRQKIGLANKGKNNRIGYRHSEETKLKMKHPHKKKGKKE